MKRDDAYFEAMRTRDYRFDGKFFVGVRTTGIYCRPICPAKPKRENVEFFANALAAERAGYRPCLRCRPESAPLSPAWIGKSALVNRALKVLQEYELSEFREEEFARRFGVTPRHLRRLFTNEIGKTPKQLAGETRLNLARQLLSETSLPVHQVGYAAGFRSVRRFNDAFQTRFKRSPSAVRRTKGAAGPVTLYLSYRPPYDFENLLWTYRSHAIGQVESVAEGVYRRIIHFGGKTGRIAVSDDPTRARLKLEIDFPDTAYLGKIVSRTRAMFDLDSDPLVVSNALEADPGLKKILRRRPGIRLASGWDSFETAVVAILGQLVSVAQGRALVAAVVEHLGAPSELGAKLFPPPKAIAESRLEFLGTTGRRKQTLRDFAKAVEECKISLAPTQDVRAFIESARTIPGIGPWTANYMALRVLRHTDAFPATDLILARALELHPNHEKMSPWRGYLAALLWREYALKLKKGKQK